MSIKAMNWAMEQATGDPRAQCLLYVIADCANEEGVAWPGADWMAEKSQQSRATVYRRMDLLQASGLLVMFPRWIDENGKIWNAAAAGRRRTSPEIRLQLGVFIKQSRAIDDPEADEESALPQSQPETTQSQAETVSSHQVRRGSSHCSDDNHHLNRKKDSPLPPSGGAVAVEGWQEFEDDWGAPILRQSIAQQVWNALSSEERDMARRAARGYGVWLRQQKRPPNRLSAHLFLRERDAWDKFAKILPDVHSAGGGYPPGSPEAKAVEVLHEIAGRSEAFRKIWRRPDGTVTFRKMTPQLLALAEAPLPDQFVEADRRGAASWERMLGDFFDAEVMRQHIREGSRVPWPFAPSLEGKIYATGPPAAALATEEDWADFR